MWRKTSDLNISKAERCSSEKKYTALGLLKNVKTILTKKGDRMAFAVLEDFNGSIDLVMHSRTFEQYGSLLEDDGIVGVIGKVDFSRDAPQIRVDEIRIPEELRELGIPEVHVELIDADLSEETLIDLRSSFQDMPGPAGLFLHVPENGGRTIVKALSQISLSVNDAALAAIADKPAVAAAWKE